MSYVRDVRGKGGCIDTAVLIACGKTMVKELTKSY